MDGSGVTKEAQAVDDLLDALPPAVLMGLITTDPRVVDFFGLAGADARVGDRSGALPPADLMDLIAEGGESINSLPNSDGIQEKSLLVNEMTETRGKLKNAEISLQNSRDNYISQAKTSKS